MTRGDDAQPAGGRAARPRADQQPGRGADAAGGVPRRALLDAGGDGGLGARQSRQAQHRHPRRGQQQSPRHGDVHPPGRAERRDRALPGQRAAADRTDPRRHSRGDGQHRDLLGLPARRHDPRAGGDRRQAHALLPDVPTVAEAAACRAMPPASGSACSRRRRRPPGRRPAAARGRADHGAAGPAARCRRRASRRWPSAPSSSASASPPISSC